MGIGILWKECVLVNLSEIKESFRAFQSTNMVFTKYINTI